MNINTWQQGHFVDRREYSHWTQEEKDKAESAENLKVRPSSTGNAICMCYDPHDAKWISDRLNLAADLEEITYKFAAGQSDGQEIIDYVKKALS